MIAMARALGWRVAHTPPVKMERGWGTAISADGRGFPDLLLVRDRVVVAEVKGKGDKLSPEQEKWLDAFLTAGIEAYVWTLKEWEDGTVEKILRARSQA